MNKQQFEERVEQIPFSGCWIWMQGLRNDYGSVRYGDCAEYAHRVAWWLYKGHIPKGLMVLHRCNVKCCVNPEHLYAGTNIDNCSDYWNTSPVHYNTAKTHCTHGHPLENYNLMFDTRGDRMCRECNRLRSAAWRRGEKWLV